MLQPLLPSTTDYRYQPNYYEDYGNLSLNRNEDPADPQRAIDLSQGAVTAQYNLWSGRYLLGDGITNSEITIPAEGNSEVSVTLPPQQEENYSEQSTVIGYQLILPKFDKKALGNRRIADSASYLHNGTQGVNRSYDELHIGENWLELPADATTISIQWPGWGIIRSYPLKKQGRVDGHAALRPTGWTPGITIAGKIFDRRGKPVKKASLTIFYNPSYSNGNNYSVSTDQYGKFIINGLLPNQQIMLWDGNAGWKITIADTNITDLILHREDNPVHININEGESNSLYWWFPEHGTPQQLYSIWGNIGLYDLLPGSGWLWHTDNSRGEGVFQYCRLQPGYNSMQIKPSSTSLGIYFPYEAGQALPGGVTVTGLEECAGINAFYPGIQWVKSAQLDLLAGQISALPVGKFLIGVQTTHGLVEETVEIGEYGAELHLQFPKEDNSSATANSKDKEKGNQQQIEENMHQLHDAVMQLMH